MSRGVGSTVGHLLRKARTRVRPNLRCLPQSRIRRCGCCERLTLLVSLSEGEEHKVCVRCRANLRYEMLDRARSYVRTYYSPTDPLGHLRPDGARCEDLTRLTLPDASVDVRAASTSSRCRRDPCPARAPRL